ncbi:MAG: protein kinase [Candidatus Riflebacteria bacterium]|nr:protein kinase [Candidatus Riflebacteria bacterium]
MVEPSDLDQLKQVWADEAFQTASADATWKLPADTVALPATPGVGPREGAPAVSPPAARLRKATVADRPDEGPAADLTLLEKIGAGGMGMVFAARQVSVDREIALKMIHPALTRNEAVRGKFVQEARVTADLDHPNIVPLHDLGETEDGRLFYSMKLVRGKAWRSVMADRSERENVEILLRVCDAVAFAHSRKFIHRDLKPDNVMLGDFGEVLVMDWGLAVAVDAAGVSHDLTAATGAAGTPAYMAPEMARGDLAQIGVASDIYLLGGILFRILTGVAPHPGEEALPAIAAAARNTLAPADRDDELMAIARRCLATRPADRFSGVKELQQAVREALSHEESLALTRSAREVLAAGARDYASFAKAIFGFEQAIRLWPGNPEAGRLLPETQLGYAEAAFDRGDLELAHGILSPADPAHRNLLAQVEAAQAWRKEFMESSLLMRYGGPALVFILFLAACLGGAWLHQKQVLFARLNYFSSIGQADRTIAFSRTSGQNFRQETARRILDDTQAEVRGWEWGYLQRMLEASPTFQVAVNSSSQCEFSPDGTVLRVLEKEGRFGMSLLSLREFDAATGRLVRRVPLGHDLSRDPAIALQGGRALIHDGAGWALHDASSGAILGTGRSALATAALSIHILASTHRLALFDPSARACEVFDLAAAGGPPGGGPSFRQDADAFAVSLDQKFLATRVGRKLSVIEVASGSVVASLIMPEDFRPDFGPSPGGGLRHFLRSNLPEKLGGYSFSELPPLLPIQNPDLDRHRAIALSHDGQTVVVFSDGEAGSMWAWPIQGKDLIPHLPMGTAIRFGRDGLRVIQDGGVLIAGGTATRQPERRFQAFVGRAASFAVSEDSRFLMVAGETGGAEVWRVDTGATANSFQAAVGSIRACLFDPTGDRVLLVGENTAMVFPLGARPEACRTVTLPGARPPFAFLDQGRKVVSGSRSPGAPEGDASGPVCLWDAETGDLLRTWAERRAPVRLVPSPDAATLLGFFGHRRLDWWETGTGASCPLHIPGPDRWGVPFFPNLAHEAFSPDGASAILFSAGRGFRVLNTTTGMFGPLFSAMHGGWFALGPDGHKIAVTNELGVTQLAFPPRNPEREERTGSVSFGRSDDRVVTVCYAPDGRRLFVGCNSGLIYVLGESLEFLSTLRGHFGEVTALALPRNGQRLLSAGSDEAVKLWDPETGSEVLSLRGRPGRPAALALSGDDRTLRAIYGDGTLLTWRANPWRKE